MNSSKLNDWLQIGASVGLMLGLVMVAYEIRISNRLGVEQAAADRMGKWTTLSEVAISTNASDLFVRAHEGDKLTRAETRKLANLTSVFLNTIFYDWTLTQTGTLTFPGGFESFYRSTIQSYVGHEHGRRHWETIRGAWRAPFSEIIDDALAAPDPRDVVGELDYIRGETDLIE